MKFRIDARETFNKVTIHGLDFDVIITPEKFSVHHTDPETRTFYAIATGRSRGGRKVAKAKATRALEFIHAMGKVSPRAIMTETRERVW